jgi:drug/metabolite transporter (DMT)-like permease
LSFLTPLFSTLLLLCLRHEAPGWHVVGATALIVGAAAIGLRQR